MESGHRSKRTKRFFITGGIVLIALCLLSLRCGSVYIPFFDFFSSLFRKSDSVYSVIIHSVRIPETASALLSGAGLGISGHLLQNVTDNKMASPNLIGVSQGAGFGVIMMLYFFPSLSPFTPVFAFIGSFASTLIIVALSRKIGFTKANVILVGIAFSSVLSAGISLISLLDSDVLVSYNAFSIGSLTDIPLSRLAIPCVMISICFVLAVMFSKKCDMLLLGDDVAASLGENPSSVRLFFMLLASICSGAVVSFAGLLGFVGLMSPHIARLFVKENSKVMIPACSVTGCCLVLLSHIISKVLFAPSNIPVGIVLSSAGALFFLGILLFKGGKGHA